MMPRLDVSVAKHIRFTERFGMLLRAEAFNAFNTANTAAGVFNSNPNSASFGTFARQNATQVTAGILQLRPRVIQLGARLTF
jgi:hypothetical protein